MAPKDVGDMKPRQQIGDWLTYQDEKTERAHSLFTPNEKEISQRRGVVANSLNLFRPGGVGFIDCLERRAISRPPITIIGSSLEHF